MLDAVARALETSECSPDSELVDPAIWKRAAARSGGT